MGILGIWANDVFLLIFFNLSAMDNYSKRDVLEMFNTNEKNVIAWFLSLNPLPICQLIKIFREKKWSRDISRDLSTQHLYFMLKKTMSFFYVYQILIPLNPLYRSNSQ